MEILEGHNKFYVNDAEGNQVAEIVFVPTGEHLSIIEHTDVDPSLKGQGVGKQLVAKVVQKMRGENRKIIPLCPFAKHEFDNTREYDDIRVAMNHKLKATWCAENSARGLTLLSALVAPSPRAAHSTDKHHRHTQHTHNQRQQVTDGAVRF